MKELRWRSQPAIIPARTTTGDATSVVVGVLETDHGPKRAVAVGHDDVAAVLPRQAMAELVHHARCTLTESIPDDWKS